MAVVPGWFQGTETSEMEETVLYYFCLNELTPVLLMMRAKTQKLVHVSLGEDEEALLRSAELDFERLSKKTHIRYHLRKAESLGHDEEFAKMQRQFVSLLEAGEDEGDGKACPEYEFLFGTPFQRKVWTELTKVAFGGTITYGELARKISLPNTIRAVGTAVGQNKLAVVIPCHRCLPSDGKIGKFRWGSDIKQKLLLHEKLIKRRENSAQAPL